MLKKLIPLRRYLDDLFLIFDDNVMMEQSGAEILCFLNYFSPVGAAQMCVWYNRFIIITVGLQL